MRSLYNHLYKKFVYNFFLRLLLESYLELCICAFVNMTVLNFTTYGDAIGSAFALGLTAILPIIPFGLFFFLNCYREKLQW